MTFAFSALRAFFLTLSVFLSRFLLRADHVKKVVPRSHAQEVGENKIEKRKEKSKERETERARERKNEGGRQ